MQPIIYYFEQLWEFILGTDFNFIEMWKNGDGVGLLSFFCVTMMIFGFFLRPIYRLGTGKSALGNLKNWRKL